MAKKKSEPKPASRASYASKTAPRVKDNTTSEDDDGGGSSSSSQSSSSDNENQAPPGQQQNKPAPQQNRLLKTKDAKPVPKQTAGKSVFKAPKKKTRVLAEIRHLQRSTDLLIPRAPFIRLVSLIN
jgi:hypothetical protein